MDTLGAQRIEEAAKRLCSTCHFKAQYGPYGGCGIDGLLLPLTSNGEDCPYFLTENFAKQALQAACEQGWPSATS
jgi:hypothetical protein